MIFEYDRETVVIQRKFIGFEAKLETTPYVLNYDAMLGRDLKPKTFPTTRGCGVTHIVRDVEG